MINFICGIVTMLVVIIFITWGFIMGQEDVIDKALLGDTVSAYGKKWEVTARVKESSDDKK